MEQTKLDSQQAFEIAKNFHVLAVTIGNYRFDNWNQLSPAQRKSLEDFEWTLSNYSSDFNYKSISLLANSKETKTAIANIKDATQKMKNAITNLTKVGEVIGIATAAFTLGGAIISGDFQAIAKAVAGVVTTVQGNGHS